MLIAALTACSSTSGGTTPETLSDIYTYSDSKDDPGAGRRFTLDGIVIVLDPGHGVFEKNYQEPVSPGSSETKSAFSTGTQGAVLTEAEFNLIIAKKLESILCDLGAEVYLTREDETSISNIERAEFANNLGADLAVRIHADGNENPDVNGITMLVPAPGTIGSELENISREIGECVLDALIVATGAKNRGISERRDMTGFNWSTVPVILVECGFMTNSEEDALLSTESYQNTIAAAIADGLVSYYSNHNNNE